MNGVITFLIQNHMWTKHDVAHIMRIDICAHTSNEMVDTEY